MAGSPWPRACRSCPWMPSSRRAGSSKAARWGETERILSLPANLAARFHGLFPGTAVNIFELVNRLILPRPVADGAATVKGMEAQERLASPLFEFLTRGGFRPPAATTSTRRLPQRMMPDNP